MHTTWTHSWKCTWLAAIHRFAKGRCLAVWLIPTGLLAFPIFQPRHANCTLVIHLILILLFAVPPCMARTWVFVSRCFGLLRQLLTCLLPHARVVGATAWTERRTISSTTKWLTPLGCVSEFLWWQDFWLRVVNCGLGLNLRPGPFEVILRLTNQTLPD